MQKYNIAEGVMDLKRQPQMNHRSASLNPRPELVCSLIAFATRRSRLRAGDSKRQSDTVSLLLRSTQHDRNRKLIADAFQPYFLAQSTASVSNSNTIITPRIQ